MGNLMTSMYTGVSGLRVNQHSLNVTAHNIANIDTIGYTRQQILTKDFTYNTIGQSYISAMQVGLGTDMTVIRQVRDVFMDKAYRLELGRQNFYEAQYGAVEEIENLFGELDGVAFKNDLSNLWGSISDLAMEPDNIVKRGILVTTAQSFINRASVISKQMKEYQENLNSQIQEKVDRVNEIGERIMELNDAIRKYQSSDQQPNDLRDERNMLLDELGSLVNCSYKEDSFGSVSINVEGVQFLVDDQLTRMATERVVTEREQEKADEVNRLAQILLDAYNGAGGDAAGLAAMKAAPEWKLLKEYGNITAKVDANGLHFERNGAPLNKWDPTARAEVLQPVLPKQSNLLNVIWKGNGLGDVFRLNGDYSSAKNTDIGSIKGLLVARGVYDAKYTDIPDEADYKNADGTWIDFSYTDAAGNKVNITGEDKYKAALDEYNKNITPCIMMQTQGQFDKLIHDVVTAINDVLCPNVKVTEDSLKNLIEKKGGTLPADTAGMKVTMPDGTVMALDEDMLMLDEIEASTGMDDNKTIGEALFNRKSTERYTEAILMEADGKTPVTDEAGNPIKIYVYNKEYESNNYSLFTIDEIEINEEILQDYSKIPLSYNKYSGLLGGYDMETANELMHIWDEKGLKLDPNSITTYNFADYYAALTSEIAYKGNLYNEIATNQQDVTNTLDNKRQEVAGTSSDEELTNLIKYQHAYNASSRYINVINEMLEHIITKLG